MYSSLYSPWARHRAGSVALHAAVDAEEVVEREDQRRADLHVVVSPCGLGAHRPVVLGWHYSSNTTCLLR